MRKQQTAALITHSAAAAGANSTDQFAHGKGMLLFIDVSDISGTSPTLTVTLQGKSPAGNYYTILASAAISATGTTVLRVYPGIVSAANSAANDIVPETYRVSTAIGGTTPSVSATVYALIVE